jgi:hypothetical protein
VRQEAKEDLRSESLRSRRSPRRPWLASQLWTCSWSRRSSRSRRTRRRFAAALWLAGSALVITVALAAFAWHKHVREPLDSHPENVK